MCVSELRPPWAESACSRACTLTGGAGRGGSHVFLAAVHECTPRDEKLTIPPSPKTTALRACAGEATRDRRYLPFVKTTWCLGFCDDAHGAQASLVRRSHTQAFVLGTRSERRPAPHVLSYDRLPTPQNQSGRHIRGSDRRRHMAILRAR